MTAEQLPPVSAWKTEKLIRHEANEPMILAEIAMSLLEGGRDPQSTQELEAAYETTQSRLEAIRSELALRASARMVA